MRPCTLCFTTIRPKHDASDILSFLCSWWIRIYLSKEYDWKTTTRVYRYCHTPIFRTSGDLFQKTFKLILYTFLFENDCIKWCICRTLDILKTEEVRYWKGKRLKVTLKLIWTNLTSTSRNEQNPIIVSLLLYVCLISAYY